jgi:hypothetical protein
MKKQIFFVGVMVGACNLYGSIDSDRIDRQLSNAAPKAFGSFMMFKDRINPQGLDEWNAAINEGKDVIATANKKSKKVLEYCKRIDDANNELINTIKLTYNMMFMPFVAVNKLSDEQLIENLRSKKKFIGIFANIKDNMEQLRKKMKKDKLAEGDTADSLATYLANYADNAMNSIDYWVSTKSSKFYISPLVSDPDQPSSERGWKISNDIRKYD